LAGEISGVGDDGVGSGSDDFGGGSGSGSGSGSDNQNQNVPHVTVSLDKATVSSDLNVDTVINITVNGTMGFSGDVTLAATAANAGTAITDWKLNLAKTTLTLPTDGSMSTTLTVAALGDAAMLTGNIKITATSPAGTVDMPVAVTFNPVLAIQFNDNAGKCVYPVNRGANNPWLLKVGRQIKVTNGSATLSMVVHSQNVAGFPHESDADFRAPGTSYIKTPTAVGDQGTFYCHNPNTGVTGPAMTDSGNSALYQVLRVVQ
jgi:hypothetical protein